MIEVEAKCILTPTSKAALLHDAVLQNEKEFVVEFWDNDSWDLGLKNVTLKKKNGKFELKVPTTANDPTSFTASMDELTSDESIYQALQLKQVQDLESDLRAQGYSPRANIHTVRTTYHKEGFIIDLDATTLPILKDNSNVQYEIAEIELQVNTKDEVHVAHEKISEFAQRNGITISNSRGKYLQFIYLNYPDHYQNIVKIGVIDK